MMKKITLSLTTFILITFSISNSILQAQDFVEIQKLLADDGSSSDRFGFSVSVSGEYAIVGAYQDDDSGSNSGSAYIFHMNDGIWQFQSKLTADDGASYDHFGQTVSISGEYAIVGSYQDDDNGNGSGSAYIFYNNNGTWQQQAKLLASDGAYDDNFGRSVSICGNSLIVGAHATAPMKIGGNKDDYFGSAYIFYNNNGTWQEQAKLSASDGAYGDEFGNSVSIFGNNAIVGASSDDDNGSSSGSAYIFSNNSGTWQQQAKLLASDGASNGNFGASVCISSDYAIIGAPGYDDSGSSSGSAYIFHNNFGTWQQQAKLTASDGANYDRFGEVSIYSNTAIVGASYDDDNGNGSGSAYIFGIPQSQNDSLSLSLTAFLEGPYNGFEMNTHLNPEPIPLSQPYYDPLKWNYQGTEIVDSIPNADVVDWVLVELRETTGDASTALPDSMITQQAAFILKDGAIVGLDGTSPLLFDNEITDNLYVVVYHRNHLPIMSSEPLTAAKGDYNWDFTTAMSQAYGTDAQVDLGDGVFGMIGGDGNSNGQIEYYDKDSVWTAEAGNAEYLSGDFSLDQQIDNIDKNEIWEPNLDIKNQVPGNLCIPQPVGADAGPDTDWECDWGATLSANSPVNGNGVWSIIYGDNGWFDNVNDPGTIFYGDPGNTYKLKWKISTQCASSQDFVIVEFAPYPTQANAGLDQIHISGTQTILQGNMPDIYEFGEWGIISGEGGSFQDPLDPNTLFYGVAGNTYELRWMVSNVCYPSEDFVNISFVIPFTCGNFLIDDRDGQSYNTVQIGSQCWMAENLNIGTMIDESYDQTDNGVIEKYCNGSPPNPCDTYGGLYQWNEMMEYVTIPAVKGICPAGWHIPTIGEYSTLIDFLGGNTVAGGKMKEVGTTHWYPPNMGATNSSGFTGLPGGHYSSLFGVFYHIMYYGFWWSSTENGTVNAWFCELGNNFSSAGISSLNRQDGYSVRCINDGTFSNQPPSQPSNPAPQNGSPYISIDTTLSWACFDPNSDDLTYNIYFGTEADPPLILVNQADTFYNPGTLLNDTTYYWKIVAYDIPGDSTVGDIWSFSTYSGQSPNQPSNLYPQNGSTNISTNTTLSWSCSNPEGDDLTYNIYFGTDTNPQLIQINHVDTLYYPGTLLFDTTYYWKIVAYNTPGDSTIGEVWSFSTEIIGFTWQEVNNPITGRTWMDRNLGASRVALSNTDEEAYGDLFQWGRAAESHESRTSGTTSTNATIAIPNIGNTWDGLYITENSSPFDWLTPQDNALWQGADGTNNPCPSGFRLPTDAEWVVELNSWSSNNAAGAFDSPLKLVVGGSRSRIDGSLYNVDSRGYYWSGSVNGNNSLYLYFNSSSANMNWSVRASGFSVRCIKDE